MRYLVMALVLLAVLFIYECNMADDKNTVVTEEEAVVLNLPDFEKSNAGSGGWLRYPIRLELDGTASILSISVPGAKMPQPLKIGDKIKVRVYRWKDSGKVRYVTVHLSK